MTWFRVDDKMHDHRKMRAAGIDAVGLWSMAGSWSADNLTDGFVPCSVLPRWSPRWRTIASRLVSVGLWEACNEGGEQGYRFHEWHDHQPTREEVLAKRREAADRQKRARERAKEVRDEQRDERVTHAGVTRDVRSDSRVSNGVSHGPPDPTRPDPLKDPPTPQPQPAGVVVIPDGQTITGDPRFPTAVQTVMDALGCDERRAVTVITTHQLPARVDDPLAHVVRCVQHQPDRYRPQPALALVTSAQQGKRRPPRSTTDERVAATLALAAELKAQGR